MRVVHLAPTYVSSGAEGISRNIDALCRALSRRGIVVRLEAPEVSLDRLNHHRVLVQGAWASRKALAQALADPDVDAVHYHTSVAALAMFAGLGRPRLRARKPVVVHVWNACYDRAQVHGAPRRSDRAWHALANGPRLARAALAGADAVVVSSRYQERQLRDAGVRAPLRVVPNGVDLQAFRPRTSPERAAARSRLGLGPGPVVAYVGHLSSWKGVDVLVDALPALFRERPDAQAVMAHTSYGRGAARLRARLAARGVAGQVVLLGECDVPELLGAVDFAALPLLAPVGTACHPNVLLECLASGLPVVASDVGTVPEVITHPKDGLLARPGDPADLASRLVALAGDAALRKRLGAEARRTACERFDWELAARSLEELYRDLVLLGPGAPPRRVAVPVLAPEKKPEVAPT